MSIFMIDMKSGINIISLMMMMSSYVSIVILLLLYSSAAFAYAFASVDVNKLQVGSSSSKISAAGKSHGSSLLDSSNFLEPFMDRLPNMPTLYSYQQYDDHESLKNIKDGGAAMIIITKPLTIGMFEKKWKFHRDLPETPVFAYGTTVESATVPGPTIEALQGTPTLVKWENHLPNSHILPWDPTIPIPPSLTQYHPNNKNHIIGSYQQGGIPTVVHLHGGVHPPSSDGHPYAWFTSNFDQTGPAWTNQTYSYPNVQPPGNLWYHDHAIGLTRVNLLAGLFGAYIIRSPRVETKLGLPIGSHYDRHLVLCDRSFFKNGSLFMNSTGNNPSIHPQWQPEYFGDAIIVNGKAWPFLKVQRRRYRFRIINASNARFFRLFLRSTQGDDLVLPFLHIGSDSRYLAKPVASSTTSEFLLAPSEIGDVIVDFSTLDMNIKEVLLANDAPYPYPSGDLATPPTRGGNGLVMKFIITEPKSTTITTTIVVVAPAKQVTPISVLPDQREYERLLGWTGLDDLIRTSSSVENTMTRRYITMYEYTRAGTDEPVRLLLNGKTFDDPVTEKVRAGPDELWFVINLTEDNHPMHIHLGVFMALEQREMIGLEEFKTCMDKENDALECGIGMHAKGRLVEVPPHERGWKNVFKMRPGTVTKIRVRFSLPKSSSSSSGYVAPYPFDASGEPGYVYHCHILDHEDNMMMRPLMILP